jgi:hypothetical protein
LDDRPLFPQSAMRSTHPRKGSRPCSSPTDGVRGDDFLGVQSYTSQLVDKDGIVPAVESPDNTLTGWAYRPYAFGIALRQAWGRR